jgi:hypothetical protein
MRLSRAWRNLSSRRAAGGIGVDRTACRSAAADHTGCRQGLRQPRVRYGVARESRHPAGRAKYQRAPLSNRWPHHPPPRIRGLPAHPQTRRGGLRLGQDGGRPAQDAASRSAQGRLAIYPRDGRLRSGPFAQIARRTGGLSLVHLCQLDPAPPFYYKHAPHSRRRPPGNSPEHLMRHKFAIFQHPASESRQHAGLANEVLCGSALSGPAPYQSFNITSIRKYSARVRVPDYSIGPAGRPLISASGSRGIRSASARIALTASLSAPSADRRRRMPPLDQRPADITLLRSDPAIMLFARLRATVRRLRSLNY